jgi:hypothetical protein
VRYRAVCFSIRKPLGLNNRIDGRNGMKKLTRERFVALMVSLIVGSFVALVVAHIFALLYRENYQSTAHQETIFIAALTLGLMIVLILPYIITEEQVKRNIGQKVEQEIENYWRSFYQKDMNQFISKSERDYAHTSRMIAYLLKQKSNYYWAMTWAGDSVVAYIRRFKEQPADFQLNREYFKFSLKIMKISFNERGNGTFLEDNMDLEYDLNSEGNSKKNFFSKKANLEVNKDLINKINRKIFEGEKITSDEKKINAVKELRRVILRYIKWQCLIYIEIQEHEKLSDEVIDLIDERLGLTFEKDFKIMVNNTLKSFYYDEKDADKEQFISDIVKKVELKKEQEQVRKYLEENVLKSTAI